uniref:Riboflavin biosynthesis protein PYRD, chloroplastic n=1 Tax=Kalanchoe fedtschenkoi TaxID=63787 RepID=A0A7N0UZJ6_KALFE
MIFQTLLHHQPPYLTLPSPSFPPNFIFAVSAQPRFVRRQISMPRNAVWNLGVRCQTSTSEAKCDDGFYIRRAVELARKATGCTSPNPMVGCVIVKNGEIVGQGFHPKAGQPHAEVFALRDAGELAEDATAYVTLEPCNHYGRTPPCSEALIKAKVRRVVVGMVDPNPIVASKGVEKLRSAGIEVTVGVEEELCKRLNEAYIHKMLTGKPFVTLRYALSVNGHLLDQLGEGAAEYGGYYSKLLQEYDAILSPASSLQGGLSLPTSQEPGANQPLHILVAKDPNEAVQLPIEAHDPSKVIIFTDKETTEETKLSGSGIETVVLDRISLDPILEYCNQQGKCSLLFDLRGDCGDYVEMVEECFERNLVQKVVVEILPLWSGDQDEEASRWSLQNPKGIKKLNRLTTMLAGDNVVLEGYF